MENDSHCPVCMARLRPGVKYCTQCGSSQAGGAPTRPLRPGDLVRDRYLVDRVLDSGVDKGGMGRVFLVRNKDHDDQAYALKELTESGNVDLIERFKMEDKFLSRLPRTVTVKSHDCFAYNGRYYMLMDLANGATLSRTLERFQQKHGSPGLPWREVLRCAIQISHILTTLHQQRIFHRDIKPQNIFLSADDGGVRLLDFGVARRGEVESGTVVYSEGYAPEEQYRGATTPLNDLYAFGATIHHLITGQRPVKGASFERLRQGPPELAALVEDLVRPSPADRPPSATVVTQDLVRLFTGGNAFDPNEFDPQVAYIVRRMAVEPLICSVCLTERGLNRFCATCGLHLVGSSARSSPNYQAYGQPPRTRLRLPLGYWLRVSVRRITVIDHDTELPREEIALGVPESDCLYILAEVPDMQGFTAPVQVDAWLYRSEKQDENPILRPVVDPVQGAQVLASLNRFLNG